MHMDSIPLVDDLALWRGKLLARLLAVVFVVGWIVGLPSMVLAAVERLWPVAVADGIA